MIAPRTCVGVATLLVLSVSCAGSTKSATPGSAPAPSAAQRSSTVISEQELQDPKVISRDAMSALRSLRPNFFSYHGPTGSGEAGAGEVQVSNDYGPLQSAQTLKGMTTLGLVEVRYLKPEEAALRFGLNANSGPVIVLLHNKNQ
jgi:hypothetical protein